MDEQKNCKQGICGQEICEQKVCKQEVCKQKICKQKICFIICSNDELYTSECLYYIEHLSVPEGFRIEILTVEDAKSMTAGYNEAMQCSEAKYKVYLHQDTFIVNTDFIRDFLDVFRQDETIGMIGMVGSPELPENGIAWKGKRCGALYEQCIYDTLTFSMGNEHLTEVEAIDGLLMITQYDIPWREDLFDKWDFYDCSQSQEFIRRGYKVVVPAMKEPWCVHDCGLMNLTNYETERQKFLKEYREHRGDQVVCFIVCSNDRLYTEECLYYINHLQIPAGYQIEVLTVEDAKSMTAGYNEAMRCSEAKYKVYLHQDTFLINPHFISDFLDIFRHNEQIGMIGNIGAAWLPDSGIMWEADRYGMLYDHHIFETVFLSNQDASKDTEYMEVEAIDGFLMITQYDIPWREDIFDKWDFYDCSQSQEFIRQGYKVVIPKMDKPWCVHDCGVNNFEHYDEERQKFLKEYK